MLFTLAFLSDRFAFGKREDKNPLLKYFTAEDFGLSAEPVSLKGGLRGFIYRNTTVRPKQELIIFCHGMGPGHIAYTTEIAYFCGFGYPVLAVDSRGCGLSDGKNIKGMYSGVQTVVNAIDFADELGYKTIYLVGHSWGAYSVLCASAKRKVSKVIAISAPLTPSKTMCDGAVNMRILPRLIAVMLRPFWWIINFIKYGAKGNANAAKCASKNSTPTLLIHGDNDSVVSLKGAPADKADGSHIIKFIVEGKGHNPYNTHKAEALLVELNAKFKRRDVADIAQFDFMGATEEDEEIMQKIINFIMG